MRRVSPHLGWNPSRATRRATWNDGIVDVTRRKIGVKGIRLYPARLGVSNQPVRNGARAARRSRRVDGGVVLRSGERTVARQPRHWAGRLRHRAAVGYGASSPSTGTDTECERKTGAWRFRSCSRFTRSRLVNGCPCGRSPVDRTRRGCGWRRRGVSHMKHSGPAASV